MRIAIGGGYRTAAEMLFDVNAGLAVAYEHFTGRLDGFGGMAGTDRPGAQFARAYDDAANAALWAYSDIVAAAGNLASIASASAANHDRANRASIIVPGGYMYDPDAPLRDNRAAKVWRHELPSSLGSDGWGPDWWHFVADAVGYLYPDASTGDLKRAAGEWTWQATVLDEYASSCEYAVGCLREQISPEIDDAVAACTLLREQLETLAGSFRQVGQLCQEYADQVEDTRDAIADAAKELLAWTVGTQIASHGLALFTAGASEVVGQSFQATRIAAAAAKIRTILAELALWVTTKLGPLNMVKTDAAAVSSVAARLNRPVSVLADVSNPRARAAMSRLARVSSTVDDAWRFDPHLLSGLPLASVQRMLRHWTRLPSRAGGGIRLNAPGAGGRQIRLMPGYPTGARPGLINAGPYAVVSQNGRRFKIPLEGNPVL